MKKLQAFQPVFCRAPWPYSPVLAGVFVEHGTLFARGMQLIAFADGRRAYVDDSRVFLCVEDAANAAQPTEPS